MVVHNEYAISWGGKRSSHLKKGLSYLSVVDDNMEECVHEQDAICSDAGGVKQHRLRGREMDWQMTYFNHSCDHTPCALCMYLWRSIEGVGVEDWLDHDE